MGQYGWVYLIEKSKVYSIVCVCIYNIYIYQIAVDGWASVDPSLSSNGYILISFLHRVNEHRRASPTNTILFNINYYLIPWLWWDVTPRWSPCAVWCAWFPKRLEPPHPLSNYVSWIYRLDTSVKLISTLTCSYIYSYYLPLSIFTYIISIYYYIVSYVLEVVHDTVIQSVSNRIFHIFNDRRWFIY